LACNGLHGVISQEIVLFITTGVRTSNPAIGNFVSFLVNLIASIYVDCETGEND
jgi:hypothetical protein